MRGGGGGAEGEEDAPRPLGGVGPGPRAPRPAEVGRGRGPSPDPARPRTRPDPAPRRRPTSLLCPRPGKRRRREVRSPPRRAVGERRVYAHRPREPPPGRVRWASPSAAKSSGVRCGRTGAPELGLLRLLPAPQAPRQARGCVHPHGPPRGSELTEAAGDPRSRRRARGCAGFSAADPRAWEQHFFPLRLRRSVREPLGPGSLRPRALRPREQGYLPARTRFPAPYDGLTAAGRRAQTRTHVLYAVSFGHSPRTERHSCPWLRPAAPP